MEDPNSPLNPHPQYKSFRQQIAELVVVCILALAICIPAIKWFNDRNRPATKTAPPPALDTRIESDKKFFDTNSADIVLTFQQPRNATLGFYMTDGKVITVNLDTGKVNIPPGVSVDEASKEFWKAVEKSYSPEAWKSKDP